MLAENTGESKTQIYRYISLTKLIPELLQMVDEGKMKMLPAVEISYLDKECQQDLLEAIESECCTPSHAQAIRMHKMFNDGELNSDTILDIMCELKPNQQERLIIPHKTLEKYIRNLLHLRKGKIMYARLWSLQQVSEKQSRKGQAIAGVCYFYPPSFQYTPLINI